MKNIISNAFSLNMLASDACLHIEHLDKERLNNLLDTWAWTSAVGHEDTAVLFTKELGRTVAFNRVSIDLEVGDFLLVGQYKGPRLHEGCKELPEGSKIDWLLVCVDNQK